MSALAQLAPQLTPDQRADLKRRLLNAHSNRMRVSLDSLERSVFSQWMQDGRWNLDAWPAQYAAVVAPVQRSLYTSAAAFIADFASLELGRPVTPTLGDTNPAWMVTAAALSATAGYKRLGHKINQGIPFTVASLETGRYLMTEAARDAWEAERQASVDLARQGEVKPKGHRKELSATACDWCVEVSSVTFDDPEDMPAHRADRCTPVPIFEG